MSTIKYRKTITAGMKEGRNEVRCANEGMMVSALPMDSNTCRTAAHHNSFIGPKGPSLLPFFISLRAPFVPDGEKREWGRAAFVTACQTFFSLLLFRRACRIMPHEQEIFKHRYRETGKIAHNGRVWGNCICAFACLAGSGRAFFLVYGEEPV